MAIFERFRHAYVISLLVLSTPNTHCGVTSPEAESIKDLYTQTFLNYNKNVRPKLNQTQAVDVSVIFNPVSITSFDTTIQRLDLQGHFSIDWSDEFVPWNSSHFYGTEYIMVEASQMWHPNLVYYKVFSGDGAIGDENKDLLIVSHSGQVIWHPLQSVSTTCDVSVKYYPFDKQRCIIYINDADLSNTAVKLTTPLSVLSTQGLRSNPEWDVLSATVTKEIHFKADVIKLTINLQRRHSLTMYTLIAPLVITGLLNVFLFLLPITSGEKCSVAITLFLSYGVLMVVTRDMMPHNSLQISLLVQYVFVLLLLSGLTVIYSIIESKLHTAYGERLVKVPRARLGIINTHIAPKENRVHVNMKDADEVISESASDEALSDENNRYVTVSDLLTWVDFALFVVGSIVGVTYSVVLYVNLTTN